MYCLYSNYVGEKTKQKKTVNVTIARCKLIIVRYKLGIARKRVWILNLHINMNLIYCASPSGFITHNLASISKLPVWVSQGLHLHLLQGAHTLWARSAQEEPPDWKTDRCLGIHTHRVSWGCCPHSQHRQHAVHRPRCQDEPRQHRQLPPQDLLHCQIKSPQTGSGFLETPGMQNTNMMR